MHGIGFVLALELESAGFGLAGRVENIAANVEFPAVIEAAQAGFLVAAEGKRSAAVRTMFAEHAQAAFAVAEDDEVFAEHAGSDRRAIGDGDFLGHAGRQPMAAHDLAHRDVAFDAG